MTPCKDCTERKIGCHARCERYREWNKQHQRLLVAERLKLSLHAANAGSAERHERWVKNHK